MLKECLDSVFLTNYPRYDVIVIDNGSIDTSCAVIERDFPNVKLIKLRENLGFSKGNNLGILHSKADFVVLLNNDTLVSPSWLSELMQEAKKNHDCFYQPKILLSENKRINSAGNYIQLLGFAFPRGLDKPDIGQYEGVHEVSYASGACVLASKDFIQKIGLLDEDDLFSYYEDVNWGWRALMLGYSSIYVSSSVIYHKWGGSYGNTLSEKKFFLIERARLATLYRNYDAKTLACLFPALLAVEMIMLLFSFKKGFASKKIRAYSDLIKAKKVLSYQKRQLLKNRKRSDKAILNHFTNGFFHPYLGTLSNPINKCLVFVGRYLRAFVR